MSARLQVCTLHTDGSKFTGTKQFIFNIVLIPQTSKASALPSHRDERFLRSCFPTKPMVRVRDVHFYRKVPYDVSEGTKLGGLISVIGVLTIMWLVREEIVDFSAKKRVTKLRLSASDTRVMPLDGPGGDEIRINFNITMKHLPCQYASVHLADHVGSHKLDGVRNIHRVRLDEKGSSLGMYQPHKYEADEQAFGHLSDHVFPWHKEMHTQVIMHAHKKGSFHSLQLPRIYASVFLNCVQVIPC